MTGTPNVPIGIGPPNVLTVNLGQGDSTLDMTTVTAVSLLVTRLLDGSTATWTCTIQSGATTSALVATYAFQTTDVTVLGTYNIAPVLTTPSGSVPGYAFQICATQPGQTMWRN